MARTVVGILRGGTSPEYDLSLKTGAAVLNALPEEQYDTRDIFIDKTGLWHSRGIPAEPARALSQVDVVVNALHGGVGEDGTVQRIMDRLSVPYVGSGPLESALSLNKIRTGITLKQSGIRMPRAVAFSHESDMPVTDMAKLVFSHFGPPYILKPPAGGASHGIVLVRTIVELPERIADSLEAYGAALVEEYVIGDEATVGVIDDFRGEELYALPPARVLYPNESPFLHFDHHARGDLRYLVPSEFSDLEKRALMDAARAAHRSLGLSGFSRADFILTRRGPYLLEVNAYPGLHEHAAFPHMLESVGASIKDLLGHALELSRR
ncbi:MAG TPA: ATP-grasp domain-containing protein [Candidatus Paceibacterota bacterium]|nr:ATP-grasp domain-containing protein [Candidatus Paceibacterota bacterium]